MASANAPKVAAIAAVAAVLLLSSMGLPAMAQEDCRNACAPGCTKVSEASCHGIASILPFLEQLCVIRLYDVCMHSCYTQCTLRCIRHQ
ncbi:hypothetical protein ACP70R_005252 [Stipagrostis hirtigluma subsp. patula]